MDSQLDSAPAAESKPSPAPSAPPLADCKTQVTPLQKFNRATKAAMSMVGLKTATGPEIQHSESHEIKRQKKKYGFLHAAIMILCFGILILTAYTENQPARYTKSHISLKDALKIEDAKQAITSDDVWEWVEDIVTGIGGKVVDHIEVNCAYESPYVQEVIVDGVAYTLLNPEVQTGACFPGSLEFIKGDGQVYLTGNHQLLSFGIFTDRSVPERPISKSNSALYDIEVLDNDISSLNPVRDEKVIEVCNTTVGRRCVLKDAPDGEIGSTLGWEGYDEDGKYYFNEASSATIYSATNQLTTEYEPCYTYVGPPTLNPTAMPISSNPPSPPPVDGGGPSTENPSPAQTGSPTVPAGPVATTPPSPPPIDGPGPPSTQEPTSGPTRAPTVPAGPEDTPPPSPPPVPGTRQPTQEPTSAPTRLPTVASTDPPSSPPVAGTRQPTQEPTSVPTRLPTVANTEPPSSPPVAGTRQPTQEPTSAPTSVPTVGDTEAPNPPPIAGTRQPTQEPTSAPTRAPTLPAKPGPDEKRHRSHALSTQAEIVDGTCEYMWITSGYDMRITCTRDRSVQQTARLAYVASYYDYKDIFGLFDGQFACGQFVQLGSSDLDSYFVHGHRNLEAYLDNEDSYGVFFSTSSQLSWTVESTLGLLNLQRNYFIDDNTRVFKVYMIARNLGREQLFYSFISVAFHIDVDGLIRVEFDVTYVPMIQYYYGLDGYSWRVREVFVFELMLVVLFVLFTLRELKQLLTKRIAPLILKWKDSLQSKQVHSEVSQSETLGDIELRSKSQVVDFQNGQIENLDKHEAGSVRSSKAVSFGGTREEPEVLSAKNFHEKIDEFGDALEDVLDDYVPDADGFLDILDWMTISILLVAIIYRFQYVEKARDLHILIKSLESDGDAFDDHLENLIGDFSELGSIASGSNMISIIAVCVGIMQFFRYLSFDKKLGIVTETIFVVFFDLLPVLFIFITIVIAYGVLGTKIYGAQQREWSTLGKSISSLFLMMLGEYGEYFELRDVSPVETGIFFWSFVVIISMILFNMVLAVILTVYEDKYKEVLEADMKEAAALEEKNAAALAFAKKKEQ